jgi:membrane fusion protein, multidrug efflux system
MHLVRIAAVMLALTVAACSQGGAEESKGAGGMPPAMVNVVTVAPRALPVAFEYIGQTAGSREVEVRARVTGILESRNFKEGEGVRQGQSLFTIDRAPYEAAVARAEADVAAAQARLEQARRNAARLKPLYAEKAVSQKDHDDAASAEAISAADLKAAQARLTEARLNLRYTRVESPITGVSGRALRSEGSLVSGPDVLLATVVQVDPMWVNFGIPDNDQARLQAEVAAGRLKLPKNGAFEVQLRLADDSVYPRNGRLDFADVRISPATGTQEARAQVPNPEGRLRPGQFVRVVLRGGVRPQALTVPQRAVLEGPQGKFVYVVNGKSQAEPRPVELGDWWGNEWIVNSGLEGGEQVIVEGVMKLGPGAPVKVAQPKAEAK